MKYEKNSIVFTDWRIVREIGEGSYGKVFEIYKTNYGITAHSALKVIRIPRSTADIRAALNEGMDEQSVTTYFQGFVDEIVQEIAVMSSLKNHPNIVSYEDHFVSSHSGEIGWDILIRMELLTPLQEYLGKHHFSENDIIRMAENLCDALAFCQKKAMIHRDIKPENIFVSETGLFKIGDFGVARTIEKTTGGLSKKGTESYMAPEVYLNKPYGSSVDIYSLGLVLYKLMNNNRLPFLPPLPQPITFADRENALSRRIKGETLPPPVNACKEFSDIILKACAYKPEERYRTAADMLEDVRELRLHLAMNKNVNTLTENNSDIIPPMASNTLAAQEKDTTQTQGVFEEISAEETIGLWNMETQTNEIDKTEEDLASDTADKEASSFIEEPYSSDGSSSFHIEEPSPSIVESQHTPEISKTGKEPDKKNKHKSKLIIAAAVLLICLCSAFVVVNMMPTKNEKESSLHMNTLLADINTLLTDNNFNEIINVCIKNQELLTKNDKGWFQNDILYFSKNYNSALPAMYFESNRDKNSFYIYKGLLDSDGNRRGNGKELCIYYTTGNYYYSEGNWENNNLASGTAVSRTTTSDNCISILSGKITNNTFAGSTSKEIIYPDGSREKSECLIIKRYRIEK
ncbi:serine/threonine-protein kinase [Frisingicoccus sp.]|uniref:serine/threonine-protein kinase n=1 Tax=Frisingicoccus sp. TaxID=1918627 RepID=UPI003AB78356